MSLTEAYHQAQWTKTVLEAPGDVKEPSDKRKLLEDADGDAMRLEVIVSVVVLDSLWSPVNTFAMKAIPIERIDIAESRLFDVEQEVERIASARMPNPTVDCLEVAAASTANQEVSWKSMSTTLTAIDNGTKVRALVDGMFLVSMNIVHMVDSRNSHFRLLKNGQDKCRCSIPYDEGSDEHVLASWVVQLKTSDTMSLAGHGFSIRVGSKMTITKLGG